MKYCKKCVQPDTRPGIYFSEDGVCGACLWEEQKKKIDWDQRKKELDEIIDKAKLYKKKKNSNYDCAIGVSGGKDSTYQAIYARDILGLRPLLVNCEPLENTEIGKTNIENLKNLGFDTIGIRANPNIAKKLIRKDFYENLNIARPLEYTLWASTYIIADRFDIPLVIQGENPGQTLGVSNTTGTDGDALKANLQNTIKKDPMAEYIFDDITKEDLFLYSYDREKLNKKGIQGIWLSNYAREWSQPHNAIFSIKYGLTIRSEEVNPYDIGTYRRFSQLDAGWLLEVNQMFKYIKFGFGQTTDHACYDIRDGLITRDEGIYLVRELDGKCGETSINSFCGLIGITIEEFWKHVNTFRGEMWKTKNEKYELINPIYQTENFNRNLKLNDIMSRLKM